MAAACRFATVVSRTTMISPITEIKSTITVNAQGRTRLLNGFDARLRLLFTKDFLAEFVGRSGSEKDTGQILLPQIRYTRPFGNSCETTNEYG